MPQNKDKSSGNLDDLLAQFADRAVDGEEQMRLEGDEELMEYQSLIYDLHQAIEAEEPSEDLTRRIESNLRIAWHNRADTQPQKQSLWSQLMEVFQGKKGYQSRAQRQQRMALVTAGAAFLLVIIVLPILTATEGLDLELPGAAGGTIVTALVIVSVVLLALAIVTVVISNRDK